MKSTRFLGALAVFFALGLRATLAGDGQIAFSNHAISTPVGGISYDVPIWIDVDGDGVRSSTEGIGTVAASMGTIAYLGMFVRGAAAPFVVAPFRTDTNGIFLSPIFQTTFVPGYRPGQSAPLTIKAWMGSSYETAQYRGSWDFDSQPLGGQPETGLPIFPPNLYPWGDPSGGGYALQKLFIPGPVAGDDLVFRGTGLNAVIPIASILANDTDPNGGSVLFSSVAAKSKGGADVIVNGDAITYTSIAAITDEFSYFVRNAAGGVTQGKVTVAVNDANGLLNFSNLNGPIFVDANSDGAMNAGEAFGEFANRYYGQSAKVGLFLRGSSTPLTVAPVAGSSVSAGVSAIAGSAPGSVVALTAKAWIGDSFDASPLKASWDFDSLPLGGTIYQGNSFAITGAEHWVGTANGYVIEAGAKPTVVNDEVTRPYRKDVTINVATLLANDSDPEGGTLTFVGVDATSAGGASVTVSGATITYHDKTEDADSFNYTVRTAHGVVGKGRVDVKVAPADGDIRFTNRGIPLTAGGGMYDVPIWVDVNFNGARDENEGIGTFAKNHLGVAAKLGLFLQGSSSALATFEFPGDSTGALLAETNDVFVTIPGNAPGAVVPLTIKVWTGSDYDTAAFKRSWDITSAPLGGPRTGQESVPTPSLANWGNENGEGFMFSLGDKPTIGSDIIIRETGEIVTVAISDLLGNDVDPSGGTITFTGVDPVSSNGVPVVFIGGAVIYNSFGISNDVFSYSVGLANGGVATGQVSVIVDDPEGSLYFSTRLVRKSTGDGVYNIPVWVDKNFNGRRDAGEGLGDFANDQFGTNATFGLFLRDGTAPIATAKFAPGHGSAFLADPIFQTVRVPGLRPGSTAPLTVKAWLGSSFDASAVKASWDFTSKPLGGGNVGVGTFEIPDISGLANEETSDGLKIVPGARPVTYGRVLTRLPGQNVTTTLAAMMANDSDPEGGTLTLQSVEEDSANGAVLTILGNTLYYIHAINDSDAPDVFEYTARNAKGGIARGRVDVVVTDGSGVFKTRLAIENTANGARISFRGVIGSHYAVQARDGLDADWQTLGEATALGFGMFEANDSTPNASRFYRVLAQP